MLHKHRATHFRALPLKPMVSDDWAIWTVKILSRDAVVGREPCGNASVSQNWSGHYESQQTTNKQQRKRETASTVQDNPTMQEFITAATA